MVLTPFILTPQIQPSVFSHRLFCSEKPTQSKWSLQNIGAKIKNLPSTIKKEALHLYHGSRLLCYEVKTSAQILWSLRHGQRKMTRRERRQLLRTLADMFRVVPFAIFILVPFLEFALPAALYFFPNMLPSTFANENQKVKIHLSEFLKG